MNQDVNPLVTFVLLTYNQSQYVREAIEGALSQTYSNLEILISDDCSTDNTWDVVQNAVADYSGPHKIQLNRNDPNMGINEHVNKTARLASGELMVMAAGDDVSLPERTSEIVKVWMDGAVGIFSNVAIVDMNGKNPKPLAAPDFSSYCPRTWWDMARKGTHSSWGCGYAFDKKIFSLFGDIPTDCLGEDAYIPFRCTLAGGVQYIDTMLVNYRAHGENVSFWAQTKAADTYEKLLAVQLVTLNHWLDVYADWEKDLNVAFKLGLIGKADMKKGVSAMVYYMQMKRMQILMLKSEWFALPGCFIVLVSRLIMMERGKYTAARLTLKAMALVMKMRFELVGMKRNT